MYFDFGVYTSRRHRVLGFKKKAIVSSYAMTVANVQEVAALKSSGGQVTHIGYGDNKLLTEASPQDGTARKLIGNAISLDNSQ